MLAPALKDDLHREIAELRDALDLRTEECRQLQATLLPPLAYPAAWRLTPQEAKMLSALYAAKGEARTHEALHIAVSGIEVETDPKIVDVYICKLRGKLKVIGVEIETIWAQGYRLTRAARARLDAAAEAHENGWPNNVLSLEVPMARAMVPAAAPVQDAGLVQIEPPELVRTLMRIASEGPQARAAALLDAAIALVRAERATLDGRDSRTESTPTSQAARRTSRSCAAASASPTAEADDDDASAPSSAETIEVMVDATPNGETVTFEGRETEISTRQAALLDALARTAPMPVDRGFLIRKVWGSKAPASVAASGLSNLIATANEAVATIGLTVCAIRGVGVVLRRKENIS